jgi:hypothetical protein
LAIAFAARVAQLVLYGGLVCWFAARIARDGAPTLGVALAAGLLLNPVLIAVVGDVLTEAPTLILALFILLCLYSSARARTGGIALAWAAAGALASNFALMMRPTNLTLIVAWNVGFAVSLLAVRPFNRAYLIVGYSGAWVATAVATWTPQVIHNLSLGYVGVLPASNLLRQQLGLGTLFMRYDSTVDTAGNADGLFVANPWCVEPWPVFTWYLDHPLNGLGTIAGHLASAFTFNHLFTYVYDWNAFYSPALAALMWALVALGVLQGVRLLLWCRLTAPPERAAIAAAVATISAFGFGTVAISAVENRFAVLLLAIVSVLAVQFILTDQGNPRGAFVLALVVAALGASVAVWQRDAAFELPDRSKISEYKCFNSVDR